MMIASARSHNASAMIAVILSIAALACGSTKAASSSPEPAGATPHAHGGSGSMRDICPMTVRGTEVSVDDTQDGIAMAFATSGDVAEVRLRVYAMAAMHERMASGGMMGSGGAVMNMAPATARAEDIERGARIILTPKNPAELADLRNQVRAHAHQMAGGHCPMMEHG